MHVLDLTEEVCAFAENAVDDPLGLEEGQHLRAIFVGPELPDERRLLERLPAPNRVQRLAIEWAGPVEQASRFRGLRRRRKPQSPRVIVDERIDILCQAIQICGVAKKRRARNSGRSKPASPR